MNYGSIVYKKTAAIFAFLRQYLGTEKFDKAMRQYFQDWKFKHPSPIDLQTSIERSCGEDLSWFFQRLDQNHRQQQLEDYRRK